MNYYRNLTLSRDTTRIYIEWWSFKYGWVDSIAPDGFQDVFMELNGSNFTIGWDDKNFSIPQFLVFVTPENKDNWTVNSYLKLQPENFNADEMHVEIARENERLNIGGGVGYLKTYNDLPPFELFGIKVSLFSAGS